MCTLSLISLFVHLFFLSFVRTLSPLLHGWKRRCVSERTTRVERSVSFFTCTDSAVETCPQNLFLLAWTITSQHSMWWQTARHPARWAHFLGMDSFLLMGKAFNNNESLKKAEADLEGHPLGPCLIARGRGTRMLFYGQGYDRPRESRPQREGRRRHRREEQDCWCF